MSGKIEYTDMRNENVYTPWEKIRSVLYFTLYGLVKYIPSPIGWIFRFAVLKMFCKRIESIRIMEGVQIYFPENVSIGKHVTLNAGVQLGGFGELIVEDWAGIAVNAMIVSEDHTFRKGKPLALQPKVSARTVIGRDVGIGAGAMVTKGVTLGQGALTGPLSLVTRDLLPNHVYTGNPTKLVGYRGPDSPHIKWIAQMTPEEAEAARLEALNI